MPSIDFMKGEMDKIEAFLNISPQTKEGLFRIASKRVFQKDECLFSSEDHVHYVYAIVSGKVSMFRINEEGHKRVFFILGEGELINEVVFDSLPVSVDCEAFENCEVLQFKKEDLMQLMVEDFQLTLGIMKSMARKQRRLYRQLKNTLPIGIEKKLAAKLWKLSKDYGSEVLDLKGYKKINMNLSSTYISYMLGTSRETISRAMKILQDKEAVVWKGKDLFVEEEKLLNFYRGRN